MPRFGEFVFGTVGTIGPSDRPDEDESLEPLGKNGAGHPRNASANVVEAPAATQDFPHDQEGPAATQHFVGARHGAELSISGHADNLARLAQPRGTDFVPHDGLSKTSLHWHDA